MQRFEGFTHRATCTERVGLLLQAGGTVCTLHLRRRKRIVTAYTHVKPAGKSVQGDGGSCAFRQTVAGQKSTGVYGTDIYNVWDQRTMRNEVSPVSVQMPQGVISSIWWPTDWLRDQCVIWVDVQLFNENWDFLKYFELEGAEPQNWARVANRATGGASSS